MKTFYTLLALIAVITAPANTIAQNSGHDFSANVTLSSDYLFRGQSQTDNAPSIQGGFDYSNDLGFYIGAWASNISFAGGIEIDGLRRFRW
ncbi:MAG: hypothetical protein ACI9XC_002730 [Gammaproteobacteria bacterium]|jgi:uncharacterized protein (TIGR02001 family)